MYILSSILEGLTALGEFFRLIVNTFKVITIKISIFVRCHCYQQCIETKIIGIFQISWFVQAAVVL